MPDKPDLKAPGLTWKPRKDSWEARWQARTDIVERGYTIKSFAIWKGIVADLTDGIAAEIKDKCESLQAEMLVWGRGGIPNTPVPHEFDGTVHSLIVCYQTDKHSPFKKKRFYTRKHYTTLCRRLDADMGHMRVAEIKGRFITSWHEDIVATGKIAMGHALITMLRTIVGFGLAVLEDGECERVALILSKMKFPDAPAREVHLTADHVVAIRKAANAEGLHSIALAQAIQFDGILRQKDVIGEWVPMEEPEPSDVFDGRKKWLRGIRWSEITDNLVLTHVTSKKNKRVTIDLKLAEMVLEELRIMGELPASGPVIVREATGLPWTANEFRREWRRLATKCGVPTNVRNMDSRAGAISEATDAGADLEHIRQAATHSDIQMTQRYSRNSAEKTANVQRARSAHRKNAS